MASKSLHLKHICIFHTWVTSKESNFLLPYVGLVGPNPGSEFKFSKQIPTPLALLTSIHGVYTEVSPERVWGDVESKFPQLNMVMMLFYTLYLPSCRLINP